MKKGTGKLFIPHTCARCGKIIERRRYKSLGGRLESVINYNHRKYCSRACGATHERKNTDKICIRCKKVLPPAKFEVWRGVSKSTGQDLTIPLNVCRDCKKLEEVIWRWRTDRSGMMLTNIECSLYLWEHAKRKILSMYPGTREMEFLNPEYNFVCPDGKKLVVRSGRVLYGHASPTWTFKSRENETADFMACFAFADTVFPLKLMHWWVLPSRVFRSKKTITITGSIRGLKRWGNFEMPMVEVIQ